MPKTVHASMPSVDAILRLNATTALIDQYGRVLVTEGIRWVIDDIRAKIPELDDKALPLLEGPAIIVEVKKYLDELLKPSLQKVFNLTGTVLHTNLGRAVLAPEAIESMIKVASGASNIEYNVESGKRGDRDNHLDKLLCKLTGAEAATVVNNNAAAVLLVLNTLGRRKEVIVSRGELIEIGGAFRVPDIMKRAGCKLVEIGTTNRTHLNDYVDAISEKTGCMMKVHTSNYIVQGFTADVSAKELCKLSQAHEIPFVEDLGSGSLIDLSRFGLPYEPMVQHVIKDGVDVAMFSGDKLLGGPQAGLIVGRKDLITKIKKNPMKRAMRLDKITIAALTATLQLYLDPDSVVERIPTLRLLTKKIEDIHEIAERVVEKLTSTFGETVRVDIIDCYSQIGSGSLPVDRLSSIALAITPTSGRSGASLKKYSEAFRALPIPVIGRIQDDAFILDLRCLEDEEGFLSQLIDLKI